MALKSSATASTSSAANLTATPSSYASGDRLIGIMGINNNGSTATPPSGWSAITSVSVGGGGAQTILAWEKVATGSDSFTFTGITGSSYAVLGVVVLSGRNSTAVSVYQTTANATSNATPYTLNLTGITPSSGDDVIACVTIDGAAADRWSKNQFADDAGSSTSEIIDTAPVNYVQLGIDIFENVGSSATGTVYCTATRDSGSGTSSFCGIVFAVGQSTSGTTYTRTLSESITASDGPLRGVNAYRQMPLDSVTLQEVLMRSQLFGRVISDNISPNDAIYRAAILYRGITDSAQINDGLIRYAKLLRGLFDSIGITDSINKTITSGNVIVSRVLQDLFNIDDAVYRQVKAARSATDIVTVSESIYRQSLAYRLTQDSATTTETVTRQMLAFRGLLESLGIIDVTSRFVSAYRKPVDLINIIDLLVVTLTQAGVTIISRVLSDNLNIQDLVSRTVKAYRKESAAIDVVDGTWYSASVVRKAVEVLTAAETISRSLQRSRTLTDTADIADVAFRYALLNRLLHEDATAADSLAEQVVYFQQLLGFILQILEKEPILYKITDDAGISMELSKI